MSDFSISQFKLFNYGNDEDGVVTDVTVSGHSGPGHSFSYIIGDISAILFRNILRVSSHVPKKRRSEISMFRRFALMLIVDQSESLAGVTKREGRKEK